MPILALPFFTTTRYYPRKDAQTQQFGIYSTGIKEGVNQYYNFKFNRGQWYFLTLRRTSNYHLQYFSYTKLIHQKKFTSDDFIHRGIDYMYLAYNPEAKSTGAQFKGQMASVAIYARGDDDSIFTNYLQLQQNPYAFKPPLPYANQYKLKEYKVYKKIMNQWFGIPSSRTIKHIFPLDGQLWDERSDVTLINNGTQFSNHTRGDIRTQSLRIENNYICLKDTTFENRYNQSTISFWIKLVTTNVGIDQTFMSFHDNTGKELYSVTNKYDYYDGGCQYLQNQYRIRRKGWYHLTLFKNNEFVPQHFQNKTTLKTYFKNIGEDDYSQYTRLSIIENDYLSHEMHEMRIGCTGVNNSVCDFYIQDIIINAKVNPSIPHYLFYQDFDIMKYSDLAVEQGETEWMDHGTRSINFTQNIQAYYPFQYNLKNPLNGQFPFSDTAKFVEDSRDPQRRKTCLQLEKYEEVVISNNFYIGKFTSWTISFWGKIVYPLQYIFEMQDNYRRVVFRLGAKFLYVYTDETKQYTKYFLPSYFDNPNNLNKWCHIVYIAYLAPGEGFVLDQIVNGGDWKQGGGFSRIRTYAPISTSAINFKIKGDHQINMQDLAIYYHANPHIPPYLYSNDTTLFKTTSQTHLYRQQQWTQFEYSQNILYFFPFQNHMKDLVNEVVQFNNIKNKFLQDAYHTRLNSYMIEMDDNTLDCHRLVGESEWTISFWLHYKDIKPLKTIMSIFYKTDTILEYNQNHLKLFNITISYKQGISYDGLLKDVLLEDQTQSKWVHLSFSKDLENLNIFKNGNLAWALNYKKKFGITFFNYNKIHMHHTSISSSTGSIYVQELIIYDKSQYYGEIIQRYLRQSHLFTYYDPLTYETDDLMPSARSAFNFESASSPKDFSYVYDYSDEQVLQLLKDKRNKKNLKQKKSKRKGRMETQDQELLQTEEELQESIDINDVYLDLALSERDFRQWNKMPENINKTQQDYEEFYSKEENYKLLFQKYKIEESEKEDENDKDKETTTEDKSLSEKEHDSNSQSENEQDSNSQSEIDSNSQSENEEDNDDENGEKQQNSKKQKKSKKEKKSRKQKKSKKQNNEFLGRNTP